MRSPTILAGSLCLHQVTHRMWTANGCRPPFQPRYSSGVVTWTEMCGQILAKKKKLSNIKFNKNGFFIGSRFVTCRQMDRHREANFLNFSLGTRKIGDEHWSRGHSLQLYEKFDVKIINDAQFRDESELADRVRSRCLETYGPGVKWVTRTSLCWKEIHKSAMTSSHLSDNSQTTPRYHGYTVQCTNKHFLSTLFPMCFGKMEFHQCKTNGRIETKIWLENLKAKD